MISKRTPHYTTQILRGLRRGWTVAKICAMGKAGLLNAGDAPDPNFPARETIWDWMVDENFASAYLESRRTGCEAMVDELLAISDDRREDDDWYISEKTGELVRAVDHEHINRSRLRVDSRKWYVAKLVPRLYGEHVQIEHKGNIDLVTSRLNEGRQRALGVVQEALTDQRGEERTLRTVIEGTVTVVQDDGSDLV